MTVAMGATLSVLMNTKNVHPMTVAMGATLSVLMNTKNVHPMTVAMGATLSVLMNTKNVHPMTVAMGATLSVLMNILVIVSNLLQRMQCHLEIPAWLSTEPAKCDAMRSGLLYCSMLFVRSDTIS